MSGDNEDDESVWDEIGEFTSADPSEVEPTDDDSATRVDDPDVIDVEPVETGEQADPDSSFEELKDEYSPETTDGPGTADLFGEAGRNETDAKTNSTSGADQPSPSGERSQRADHDDAAHGEQADTEAFDASRADPAGPADGPATDDEAIAELDGDQPSEAADAPDAEEIFDEMDVSQVDGEALWDELAGFAATADEPVEASTEPAVDSGGPDETAGGGSAESREPTGSVDSGGPGETVGSESAGASADSDEAVVDKRQYCQQCPYFSEPPGVACSHDGTTIVEVLMDGQFRLRGCPVVTDSGPDRTILNDGS